MKKLSVIYALSFLIVYFLPTNCENIEKIDIDTYCRRVSYELVCTGLQFALPDRELYLVAKERFDGSTILFKDSNLTTIPHGLFTALPEASSLKFENCKIKSLHKWNFEKGESASWFNLRSNEIQKLSSEVFVTMSGLYELNLENNLLNEFESDCFKGLSSLSTLVLSSNNITHIPPGLFSPLTALTRIYLDDNHIEVIAKDVFNTNHQLYYINIGKNNIKVFSQRIVRHLISNIELDLSHNPIEELNILNAATLTLLNTNISTVRINNLYEVVARHNPITEIVFIDSKNLRRLDLSYNQISNITNITRYGSEISVLNLSHNPIGHIKVQAFAKLSKLSELYLSGANILGLDFGSFAYRDSELSILDLSYNHLKSFDLEILSFQTKLQALYLDGNELSDLLNYKKVKEYLNSLNEIGLLDNNWNCTFLHSMVIHLHRNAIEIRLDDNIDHSIAKKIGGVECFNSKDIETTTTFVSVS